MVMMLRGGKKKRIIEAHKTCRMQCKVALHSKDSTSFCLTKQPSYAQYARVKARMALNVGVPSEVGPTYWPHVMYNIFTILEASRGL